MKVAILTTFADFKRSYSLCGVVLEQCGMLMANGVDFDLFVNEEGPWLNKESIDSQEWLKDHIRKEVPTGKLEEDVINEEVREKTVAWLDSIVDDYDVILTHDWMFVSWFVTYNAAVREVAERTSWVHWVHSAPGGRQSDRLAYAESLGTDMSDVMVCYNPLDAGAFFGAPQNFVRKHRLWDHDLMQVYPISTPRADAKQLDAVIAIFGEWKRLGYRVKLVVVNAHSTADKEKELVRQYREMALLDHNLGASDLIFTSEEKGWEYEVTYDDVQGLLRMSNIFVFPSKSEACSRILQEASMAGCLVVGNESFPPMNEFLHASTPRKTFGALRWTVDFQPSKTQWLREAAKSLLPLINHPVMKQKTHMLRLSAWETIWRDQLYPILQRATERKVVMS
jgi:hypothetical protein